VRIVSSYGRQRRHPLRQRQHGRRSIGQQATPADSAMAADLVGPGWTVGDAWPKSCSATSVQPF